MFYSQFLLSKKGPFGVIWIAAHLERKLRKKQITETDIGDSVDSILYSEVPIALRISSHLLLGVVKIYARKVSYLFHDCSEALVHIVHAFQRSAIDLPPKEVVAPYHAITLPESFDFDALGAYVDAEDAARAGTRAEFEHHVIDRDLITLQEPMEVRGISQSLFTLDGGFSEGPNPYSIAGLPTEDQISRKVHAPQEIPQEIPITAPTEGIQERFIEEDILPPLPMEEDIDLEDMDFGTDRRIDIEKRFELDRTLEEVVVVTRPTTTVVNEEVRMEVEQTEKEAVVEEERHEVEEIPIAQAEKSPLRGVSPPKSPAAAPEEDVLGAILGVRTPKPAAEVPPEPPKQRKRKRKLLFDNVTTITSINMKRQLGSSSDLVRLRKKAPCTEYQIWMSQRDNNIDQRFSGPFVPAMCPELKSRESFILNLKPQEPDKDRETIQEAVDDQMRAAAEERAEVPSDVEEEVNGQAVEMEIIPTVKLTIEPEVVSTPPRSPQQQEVDIQKMIEIEAVSSVKRRLEFEKPAEQVMERDVEAQLGHPSPSRLPSEAMAVAPEEATEIQFVPSAAMELLVPENALEPVQTSEELQSQGLDFLAESQEAGNGVIASNGALSYTSSYDTDKEHFGKFMQDKSGWASRTRAVALYLKEKFEAQGIDEECRLSLDNTLKGRRRKEAARMFFEILVLRSKDFIQVEQPDGVSDIQMRPTEHLMKGSW